MLNTSKFNALTIFGGGVVSRLLKTLQTLSFKAERGWA